MPLALFPPRPRLSTRPKALALALLLTSALAPVAAPMAAEEEDAGPVATLALAMTLYAEAESRKDGLAMAAAARLAAQLQERPASGWAVEVKRLPRKAPLLPPETPHLPAASLLSGDAMRGAFLTAEGDEEMTAILLDQPGPEGQPPLGALTLERAALPGRHKATWELIRPGQIPSEIAVFASGPAALLWHVEGEDGAIPCPAAPTSGTALGRFTPEANGFYRVIIENRGEAAADYLLVTN